jgi:hypothetical protein
MDHSTPRSPATVGTTRLVRLQLIGWLPARSWPWSLVALSFGINLLIISNLGDEARAAFWTGGLLTIYVGAFLICVFTMTQWLPFALGHSVTRSRFYWSALLVTLGQCLVFAVVLTGLQAIERATDGWGQSLEYFGPSHLVVDNVAAQLIVYFVSLVAASVWGMLWGLVHRRWGVQGVLAGLVVSLVAMFLVVVVLTRPGVWTALVDWYVVQPQLAVLLVWSLVPGAVAGVIGYLLIRRTTPA